MKKILLINYSTQSCGIQQYGYNLGLVLKKYTKHNFEYLETDSYIDFINYTSE